MEDTGISLRVLLLSAGILALSGCADVAKQDSKSGKAKNTQEALDADPLEPLNRAIYKFNYTVDGVVLKPVTQVYRGVIPEQGRTMVSNFLDNLYTPVIFVNSVLQADPQNSFASFWRFVLNTTFGLGGVNDFASDAAGLKNRPADFGQTLAMCGMASGPYIVLPIIGPSNARDAVGRVADAAMNPFNYIDEGVSITMWTATAIDARSRNSKLLDDIYTSSLDPYATFRSGYTQKRIADIKRAKESRKKALDGMKGN